MGTGSSRWIDGALYQGFEFNLISIALKTCQNFSYRSLRLHRLSGNVGELPYTFFMKLLANLM